MIGNLLSQSENVVAFEEYLANGYSEIPLRTQIKGGRLRIINLCRNNRYLSAGYYCSHWQKQEGMG